MIFAVKQGRSAQMQQKAILLLVGKKWMRAAVENLNVQRSISNINRFVFLRRNEKPIFKYNPIYVEAHFIFYFSSRDYVIF